MHLIFRRWYREVSASFSIASADLTFSFRQLYVLLHIKSETITSEMNDRGRLEGEIAGVRIGSDRVHCCLYSFTMFPRKIGKTECDYNNIINSLLYYLQRFSVLEVVGKSPLTVMPLALVVREVTCLLAVMSRLALTSIVLRNSDTIPILVTAPNIMFVFSEVLF